MMTKNQLMKERALLIKLIDLQAQRLNELTFSWTNHHKLMSEMGITYLRFEI